MFLEQVKAVIFDKDDTWTESHRHVFELYKNFGKHRSFRIPQDEEIIALWGRHIDQIIQGLWPELNGVAEWPFLSDFAKSIGFRTPVLPIAPTTFRELVNMNLLLGVITSSSRTGLDRSLAGLGFNPFLFTHSSDEMVGIEKPDPRVFDRGLALLSQKGIKKDNVVYVGDHGSDLIAARKAGIGFIAVTTGFTPREKFVNEFKHPANLVLTDISELPGLIRSKRMSLFNN